MYKLMLFASRHLFPNAKQRFCVTWYNIFQQTQILAINKSDPFLRIRQPFYHWSDSTQLSVTSISWVHWLGIATVASVPFEGHKYICFLTPPSHLYSRHYLCLRGQHAWWRYFRAAWSHVANSWGVEGNQSEVATIRLTMWWRNQTQMYFLINWHQ